MTSSLPSLKLLVACGTLVALAGCGGCFKAPDERRLLLTVTQPEPGAVLTEADKAVGDVDAGVRTEVRLQLEWESLTSGKREAAAFESAALELRRTDLDGGTFVQATMGTPTFDDGGVAYLPGVDFPENGSYELRATARAADSDLEPEAALVAVRVEVLEARPVLTRVAFSQDLDGNGKLNAAELPVGGLLELLVEGTGADTGTVTITSGDGGTVYVDAEPFTGSGTYSVDLGLDPVEGDQVFRVTLRDDQDRPSLDPDPLPSISVDQVSPVVDLLSPTDGGYSVRNLPGLANVSGVADGTLVLFEAAFADGGTWDAGAFPVDGGVAAGELLLLDGEQVLVAKAADEAGNVGQSLPVPLSINANACQVTLTSPSGSALFAGPDASTSDAGTFTLTFAGTSNCSDTPVSVLVDGVGVASGTTDGTGAFTLEVPVPPGNTRSVVVDVNGSTTLPTAVLTSNAAFALTTLLNGQTLSLLQDASPTDPGVQYAFGYAPSAGSFSVSACASVPLGAGATPCPDGSAGFFELGSNLPSSVGAFSYPEGAVQLKAVMLDGANVLAVTPVVSITVDGIRPTVTALVLQGDTNGDRTLNAAEQATGDAVALVTVDGLEVGRQVSVFQRGTTTQFGVGTLTTVGVPVSITLVGVAGPEADYALEVRMADAAGNAADTSLPAAQADIRVDRLAPPCTLTAPTLAALGVASDASGAAGYQLAMAASTAADVASVQFRANTVTGAGVVNGAQAAAELTLPSSGTVTYALGCTATDGSGNMGTEGTGSVMVDLDVPAPVITAPSAGVQTSFLLATSVSVPGEADGLEVRISSTPNSGSAAQLGTLTLASGVASGSIFYPLGAQAVVAEVTDAAGNTGTSAPVVIDQQANGCSIQLSAPAGVATYLNASDGTVSGSSLQFTLSGQAANCANTQVHIYRDPGIGCTLQSQCAAGETCREGNCWVDVATQVSDGTGSFSAGVTLSEGARELEVEMTDPGNITTHVPWLVTVDVTPPGSSAVTPSEATVRVVAPVNVNLWDDANDAYWAADGGYYADTATGVAGGQLSVSVTATGAQGGTVEVYYAGNLVGGPASVTADPANVTLTATLPQGTTGALDVRVTDVAGNLHHALGVGGSSTTVDVVAPAAPSPSLSLVSQRAATVQASWAAVFDDGSSAASGAVTGYDVRWTTDAINPAMTEASYYDATRFRQHTGGLVAGTSTNITVPPLATYSVFVRAVDEVGNYSALPGAPATQANGWTQETLLPANASHYDPGFGLSVFARDFTGDGLADVAVAVDGAGGDALGRVLVFAGVSGGAPSATPTLEIAPPTTSQASGAFGYTAAVGNFAGGSNDLLVGEPLFGDNGEGRVVGYFNQAGSGLQATLTTAPFNYVEFRGETGSQLLGLYSIAVISDINGDGFDEIVIADPYTVNGAAGRYYLFLGRSAAAWATLMSSSGGFILVSTADRLLQGPAVTGNSFFGDNEGAVSLGNVNGGGNEFALAASAADINAVYVLDGSLVSSAAQGASLTVDDPVCRLQAPLSPGPTGSNSQAGFGTAALGANLFGAPGFELAVGNPNQNNVRIYSADGQSAFGTAPSLTVARNATTGFGASVGSGDLNGDGLVDLLVGETTSSSLWVFYGTGTPGSEFGSVVTDPIVNSPAVVPGQDFFQSRVAPANLVGRRMAVGDVTGDGLPDLVSVGSASNQARIFVWH